MTTTQQEASTGLIDKALTVSAGIASRDADLATRWIDPDRFVQHNTAASDGVAGLRELVAALPGDSGRYDVARVFQDGDFVWTQSTGDMFGPKVFFDVFRFEHGLIVEHWDNLAPQDQNGGVDGPTVVVDRGLKESNRALVSDLLQDLSASPHSADLDRYFDKNVVRHGTGDSSVFQTLCVDRGDAGRVVRLDRVVNVLADGDFVLAMLAVTTADGPGGLYALLRIADGRICEQWEVVEQIAPTPEHRNHNGKF